MGEISMVNIESRKRVIIKLGVTLVVVLLGLTFFSTTLNNINIAGVVVGTDLNTIVTTTYRSFGVLDYTESYATVFSEHTGRIHLLAGDEDDVFKDDPLFEIHYTITRDQILNQLAMAPLLATGEREGK